MITEYLLGPCVGETPGEYYMRLTDRAFDEPVTRCQDANYGPSLKMEAGWRSMIDNIKHEEELRLHANVLDPTGSLWLQILTRLADQKTADPFWRHALQTQIDTLYSFHLRETDYDYDEKHYKNIEQLNAARREAGIELYAYRAKRAN